MKKIRRAFARKVERELGPLLKRLIFIDESGAHLGLTRRHGRARPGQRVVEATPGTSGPHYTMVAALGWGGVQAPLVFEGAMNARAFEVYVEEVLVPTLQCGDVVFADNLSAHKSNAARRLIEGCGARLEFLPPYSPDLNPIEQCWAKVKEALRTAKARTWDTLVEALREALLSVKSKDAIAWFAHCGYVMA